MNIVWRYRCLRSRYRRFKRLHFASPAEMKLITILGGRVLTIPRLKNPTTGFCFAIYKYGGILKRKRVSREVRVARGTFVDFAVETKYYKRAIEVLGNNWHQDVVAEKQRRDYLRSLGWHVLYIEAWRLWKQPADIKHQVEQFLDG